MHQKHGLQKQSLESFKDVTTGITYGDVYDFINEPTPEGNVYFIERMKHFVKKLNMGEKNRHLVFCIGEKNMMVPFTSENW